MAASGYTPISLYYSTTASAVPSSGNLTNGELAINITDGKLYYKNNSGAVTLLATAGTTSSQWTTTGSDIYYNTGKVGVGTSNPLLSFQTNSSSSYVAGFKSTIANGFIAFQDSGTSGALTDGSVGIGAITDDLAFRSGGAIRMRLNSSGALAVNSTPDYGTTGQVLTSAGSGAAPTWSTPSGVSTGKAIAMAMIFGF